METIELNGQKYKKVSYDLNWDQRHVYWNQNWYQLIPEEEKKEWEILSFRHRDYGTIWNKNDQGKFQGKRQYWDIGNSPESYLLKCPVYEIYQVKRLEDGEIFTLGDILKGFGKENIILKFDFHPQTKALWAVTNIERFYGGEISSIDKEIKKPLFLTEDGKDIFKGDECWSSYKDGISWKSGGQINWENPHPYPDVKYFSTKEAALSWIEENKPKPLFVTFDNVELWKKGDVVYSVCPKSTWETREFTASYLNGSLQNYRGWKGWNHFSTKEARDKYILENKPVLSLKDIEHATGTMDGHKYISLVNIVKGRL